MTQNTVWETIAPGSELQPTVHLPRSESRGPDTSLVLKSTEPAEELEATARSFQDFRQQANPGQPSAGFWHWDFAGRREHAQLFRDLHQVDPQAADRLAQALICMPEAGTEFLRFQLRAELGRGGLARVFLAQQEDLADRHVVVKVAPDLWGEARTLAQLQHPNIVPVYSVHQHEPFQAVCMPYRGWTTFRDVLQEIQSRPKLPTAGMDLVAMIKKAPTLAGGEPACDEPVSPSFTAALAGRSYVQSMVWLFAQLAGGLAHAHEHGIVHHDLKPANILLSDDGVPMLLDFDAAEDTKRSRGAVAWVAGTLPYMAPEQWAIMSGTAATVDARCDLYAFGVIMYELLTGCYPFKYREIPLGIASDHMLEDRRSAPPRLRDRNRAVSPALEAIVRRCLEPDPTRRYASARELHEDLQRQCDHLPLAHTPEPSRLERCRKWARRHPRIFSASMVAMVAGILVTGLTVRSVVHERQADVLRKQEEARVAELAARDRAVTAWQRFQDDMKNVQFFLYTRANEPEQLASGMAIARRLIDGYGAHDDPAWQQSPLVTELPLAEQEQLGRSMGELLLLYARALLLRQADEADASHKNDFLETALVLNERAAACSVEAAGSPALWRQRGELCALLGREAPARAHRAKAATLPLLTAADHYWLAGDQIATGRLREALPLLQQAVQQEPQNFWAWFVLANCHDRLGLNSRAEACYAVCIALRPAFHWAHFNRGLALLRQQDHRAACLDFDATLRLRPDLTDAYLNRALARQGLEQYRGAEEDLTAALKHGGATRLYFLRARVREKLGDKQGARSDVQEGLRLPPADEMSWLVRGYYRITDSPRAALADFDEALRINPRSQDALQNKAHVLAEILGRNEDALRVLDKALKHYPDSVKARAGRGVLLARLGRRDQALHDAEETLLRDTSPPWLYQAGCIYALTSKQNPDDRLKAFQLLSSALRSGYGLNLLDTDDDLIPIRMFPEFQRLADAARALQLVPVGKKG